MGIDEVWECAEYLLFCYNCSHDWDKACLEGLHFAKFNFGEINDSDKTWILRTAREAHTSRTNGI